MNNSDAEIRRLNGLVLEMTKLEDPALVLKDRRIMRELNRPIKTAEQWRRRLDLVWRIKDMLCKIFGPPGRFLQPMFSREVTVTEMGITLQFYDKVYTYRDTGTYWLKGKKVIAWFTPCEPGYLFLTDLKRGQATRVVNKEYATPVMDLPAYSRTAIRRMTKKACELKETLLDEYGRDMHGQPVDHGGWTLLGICPLGTNKSKLTGISGRRHGHGARGTDSKTKKTEEQNV
jgi:hypothetical protein